MDDIRSALEWNGVSVTPEEMERWAPMFQFYVDGLAKLRAIKLDGVEAATVFNAAWDE
jgi:hypothetical protein